MKRNLPQFEKLLFFYFMIGLIMVGKVSWGQQSMYWTFNQSTNNCSNNLMTSSPSSGNITGGYSLTDGCSSTSTGTSTSGSAFISVAAAGNAIRNSVPSNGTEYWYFTLSGNDLANLSNIHIYFQYRRSRTGSTYYDTNNTSVQYSLDGGNNYYGSQALTVGDQNEWVASTFDFSSISGATSIIFRIRWVQANNPCNVDIDNFQIQGTLCTTPAAPTTTGASICIGTPNGTILSASGAVSGDKYKWYDAASGGNLLKTSTDYSDYTYTTPGIGTTTNYWVSIINSGGCESSRTLVTATYPLASTDNQTPGVDYWNGYVYDGTNFSTYFGHFTEVETFNEGFGGNTNCFGIVSNSIPLSIYTETFSVKYLMSSTKKGLWVADLGSDDGNRLTVDGELIYNDWGDHSTSTHPRVLMNLNGTSSLLYEYYENGGGNVVYFENLTKVLENNLNNNTSQSICLGTSGSPISGDDYVTIPTGITKSGASGFQWTYSTTPGGARTIISGANSADFTPNTAFAPFNSPGTYYVYRNAALVSTNNTGVTNYTATNESNAATVTIGAVPTTVNVSGAGAFCGSTTITASGGSGGTIYFQGTTSGGTSTATPSTSEIITTSGTYYFRSLSASGCWSTEGSATVVVNALPTDFNVTGGGSYCSGVSNVAVGLSGSQNGVSYQLYNGINAVGSSVTGTGSVLDFGNQTVSGTYTVVATDQSTFCSRNMSGNVTVAAFSIADFSGTITNTTCPNALDGSIILDNRIDPAVEFNNSDQDFIDLGNTLLSNRSAFTIEGWVKFNKANLGSRMSLFGQNDAIEFGFSDPTTIMCWTASGGSVSMPISIYPDDNGWHHLAVVGNGTNLFFYLDGINVATGGSPTLNYGNDSNFSSKIGGGVWDGTGGWFNGQIKKIGFWSTALGQSEISTLAAGSAFYTGTEPGIIAGYNFYEGSGISVGSLPSGNTGNFVNSPSWVDVVNYTWTKTGDGSFNRTTKNIKELSAGEYNITVTNGICTKSYSFNVSPNNPATIISTQSTDGQDQCFGGNFNAIEVTASGSGTLNYQWYRNTTASASGGTALGSDNGAQTSSYTPQASETGTFYYYCEVSASCGNTTSAVSGAFIVSALPDAPIPGSNTFTYDGSIKTASATVGTNETIDWYANYTGSTTSSVPSETNVGTYTAYAETRNTNTGCVSATRTLVTLTIEKANSNVTSTGTTTFTYNGLEQGPATSIVNGSTGAVTYSYSGTGSTIYGPIEILPTDAGTYEVIATVATDANHNGAVSAALPFIINKAIITITADNQTVVFGTPIASVTGAGSYIPTGFVNSETSAVISGTATYNTTYTEATAAGATGVTIIPEVNGLTATNYTFTPAAGTITIDKANSTITVTGTTSYTYNGLEQGPATSTVTGSTGAITYSYSGTGSTTYGPTETLPTEAGTYEVIATVITDTNYNGETSAALPFAIGKALLTITANAQSKCFGTIFNFTETEFTSEGLLNGDEVSSVTLTSSGSLVDATEGIYNIVPNAAEGTGLDNYEITYSTDGVLTVNALPTGTLSNSGSVCSGSGTSLTFTKIAGMGPFDLVINGKTYTDIASGGTIDTDPITLSTIYNLTSITDKGVNPNCPNVVDVSTTVEVYPIEVNATIGLTQACYNTVKEAFDKINDGTHTGEIIVKVHGSTTETASANLNASDSGSSSYTSVLIYPMASGLSVSGSLNAALIDLNGADNVTIDGRRNGTGDSRSLTISNSNTGTSVSTVLFRNTAENNMIKDCILSSSSRATTQGGTVFFSTATTGNGNSFNTITNCDITTADNVNPANRPMNSIYSSGSAGFENKNNTISNNNFYNFFRSAAHSYGINVLSNSSGWTISNNSFFETTTFTATGNFTYRSIFLNGVTVLGFNIDSNYIGGSAPGCGGTAWTISEGGLTVFNGIDITAVGTTAITSVQNNIIKNIDISTLTSSTTVVAFRGISTSAGTVNIIGNTIGELNTNGSIKVRAAAASGTTLVNGIQSASVTNVTIQNNNIGSVNFDGSASNILTFNGIAASGAAGNFTISGNTIGSAATSNSIAIGTSGVTTVACTFVGISIAATGINSVTDNFIQNITTFGTGTSSIQAINCSGTPSALAVGSTLNITGNKILSNTNFGTSILRGISNAAGNAANPLGSININNNVIRSNKIYSVTGTFMAIANTGIASEAINIIGNQLGNTDGGLVNYEYANSGTLTGISASGTSTNSAVTIKSNDISGITYSTAGSHAHSYITNTSVAASHDVSDNTFTNLNVNTIGSVTFISNSAAMPVNGIQTVKNNRIITGFAKNGAGGTITGITSTAATANSGVTVNIENNNFSNITVTGNTAISGIVNTDAGVGVPVKTIKNNTLANWTGETGALQGISVNGTGTSGEVALNTIGNFSNSNSITGITTGAGNDNIYSNLIYSLGAGTAIASTVSGILVNAVAANTKNINQNTIFNLSTGAGVTTGSVNGISIIRSGTINAYRNKIYDLSSSSSSLTTGTVNGIVVSGTTVTADLNATIVNNIVGDLKVTAGSGANLIRGISVDNSGTNSTISVFYNTVYLNASSSGTNFGTTGIYHRSSSTATTASLNMQNNLVVNLSTPNGSGRSVAFRRSSATTANYSSSSDNNSFYAGTPGSGNLIYSDGTNSDQTLLSFQTRMSSRDQASVSVNPVFISTSGSDANFLHLTDTNCELDGTGRPVSGISTDFDNEARDASFPDIGADEFTGTGNMPVSVIITAVPSGAVCPGTSVTFTATPVNGGSLPVYTWYNGASVINGETLSTYTSGTLNNGDVITVKLASNAICTTGNPATSNAVTMAINTLPAPTFIVSPGSDDCAFDEVVYTTQSGMSNYVWNIPGFLGSDYTIISGGTGPSDYTVTLKWITDSAKTVTVNYTDGNGCTGIPATSTVTIHPIPSIGSFN